MKNSSIIGHAREGLERFLANPRIPADQNLREFYRTRKYLGSRDRREISAIYYGVIRSFRRWIPADARARFDRSVPPPELVTHVLACYLIETGGFDAESVSIGTGRDVEEVERAVNEHRAAVADLSGVSALALDTGFPEWFVERIAAQYGQDSRALLMSLNQEADIALRFDPERISIEELKGQIESFSNASADESPWSRTSLILHGRIVLKQIPAVRSGLVVVQDIGSQMVGRACTPERGMVVFDACAGAGGKSMQLADMIGEEGRVVAHDLSRSRLSRLDERLHVAPHPSIEVLYPQEFLERREELTGTFDLVLLDSPCSGTGTIRRNPGLKLTLGPEDVDTAVSLQRRVLEDYAPLVRPGGLLVYATCSLFREENQERISEFLEGHPSFRVEAIPHGAGIPEEMIVDGYLQTRPDRHGTDGFFAARLRKGSESE